MFSFQIFDQIRRSADSAQYCWSLLVNVFWWSLICESAPDSSKFYSLCTKLLWIIYSHEHLIPDNIRSRAQWYRGKMILLSDCAENIEAFFSLLLWSRRLCISCTKASPHTQIRKKRIGPIPSSENDVSAWQWEPSRLETSHARKATGRHAGHAHVCSL